MTLTKGNLILTISQAWLLLLLEKSKLCTRTRKHYHGLFYVIKVYTFLFTIVWYYIDDEVCISQLLRLSEYDDKWFGHYQLPQKMKRAHKKYCLLVFYRAVIFSAAVFKVTFFFSFPNRYICMIVKSFSPCVNVQLFVIHSLEKLRI